jgi:hypothetical protein
MSDHLIQWEARLIELVGELHSSERRHKEAAVLHRSNVDGVRASGCSDAIRKQITGLMDLFPDVELDDSILDGVRFWRYEEFSIAEMKRPFGIIYNVSADGLLVKRRHSLRRAKNELKLLLRKRIVTQVENIMT